MAEAGGNNAASRAAAGGGAANARENAGTRRRIRFSNTAQQREFVHKNAPYLAGFADGNTTVPTAEGSRVYPVNWKGLVNRGISLDSLVTPQEKAKLLKNGPLTGEKAASMLPASITSTRAGSKGFAAPVAGYPDYMLRNLNWRRTLSGPTFQQSASEKAATRAEALRGVNMPDKMRQTAENKRRNLGYTAYSYTPGSEGSIFGPQMLQVRRAPFMAEAHEIGKKVAEEAAANRRFFEQEQLQGGPSVSVPPGMPPLPPGWVWKIDDEDNIYYYRPDGMADATWDHPGLALATEIAAKNAARGAGGRGGGAAASGGRRRRRSTRKQKRKSRK